MRRDEIKILLILSAIFLMAFASTVFANDPPHINSPSANVNCASCHNPSVTFTYATIDNTPWNEICWSCHDAGKSAEYSDTHSAISTGDNVTKRFWSGAWTNECRTCHNPHSQEQGRTYNAAYPSGAQLVTGTIASSTYNTITVSGSPWTADQWVGYNVQPNKNSLAYYRIINSTTNSLIVDTNPSGYTMPPFVRAPGSTFALTYGKLIRSDFNSHRSIVNSSGVVFSGDPYRTVKFWNSSGPYSAGYTNKDTESTTDAICVVCHTQTNHMNIGIARYGASFDSKPSYSHHYSDTEPCWNSSCHQSAAKGFAAGCTTCHGYPPVNDASLLNSAAPNGYTFRGTDYYSQITNGAGAHTTHYVTENFACSYCHTGGGPDGDHNANPGPKLHIGFDMFGTQGGNYTAPAFSNTVYSLAAGGTTGVTNAGAPGNPRTCTNIYCHSTVQADGGSGAPTYKSPQWDGSISDCNACHNYDSPQISSGSHTAHLSQGYVCNDCHSGNTHINKNIDVTVGAYTAAGTPQNGYGTCSTASCHDNGTGTLAVTPTWGTAAGCSACHKNAPTTGSHDAHLAVSTIGCGNCHDGAVKDVTATGAEHIDGNVDVYDVTSGDLGYPANKAKNTAYATCNNTYCHDNGLGVKVTTPTWGTTGGGGCNACHLTQPTTGSHTAHLGPGGANCGNCHDSAVEGSSAIAGQHTDGNIDVYDVTFGDLGYPSNKAKNSAYTTCNNAWCHDNGTGTKVTTPTWGTSITDCSECHPKQPTSGSHQKHLGSGAVCGNCHDSAVEGSTAIAGQHLDNNIDVYDTSFGDLGYPSNKAKNSAYTTCNNAYCHDNGTGTKVTTPTWGTTGGGGCNACHQTVPTTGSHSAHLGYSDISIACGNCHDSAVQGSTAIAGQHTDGNIDVYDVTFGDLGYPSNKAKNSAYTTCNNAWCHDNGRTGKVTSPTWGTSPQQCSECHQTVPTTGSHTAHLGFSGGISIACGNCHDSAVQGSNAIAGQHLDNNIDVYDVSAGDLGYTPNKAKNTAFATCNNAWCHDNGRTGKVTTPTWGTAVNDCSECHGNVPSTGSHSVHISGGAVCGNCHDSAVRGSSAIVGQHLDGNIDVYDVASGDLGYTPNKTKNTAFQSCNNAYCHEDGRNNLVVTPTWGTSSACDECHRYEPTTGSHTAHLSVSTIGCGNCHVNAVKGAVDTGVEHRDNTVDVYDVSSGDLGYPADKVKNTAFSTCNNAWCHDNGLGTKVTTPTWGVSAGCSACHQTVPTTGSHSAHLGYSDITIACGNCHDSAVQGSQAIAGQHPDNNIDVYDVSQGDLGYPANKAKNSAYTTCNNAWCHDNGRTGKITSPTWGTSPQQCSECHQTVPTTGSHSAHLGFTGGISIACGNCHDSAVQGSNAIAGQHLDNNIDVYDVASGDLGYPANKAKNTAFSTCSNAYCHDKGRGGLATTPTWGTSPAQCSECHQAQPNTGSHTKHLNSGASCGNCHDSAQQGSVYPAQHLDGNIDVYDVANGDLGYPSNKAKNSAFATCNNASCHDDGTGTKVTSPTWGTSTGDCGACHKNVPTTGSHSAHLGNTEISVACGNCHDSVIQGSSAIAGQHTDGNIDVYDVTFGDLGYPSNKAKNSAYTTCNNAYCHDNGRGAKVTTPTWGQTSACNECHLAAPTTGSHTAHLSFSDMTIACGNCHDSAVQGVSAIAGQHMDSNVDVYDVSSGDLGYPANKAKNSAYATCNNAYCHENGRLTKVTTPTWGNTVNDCSECHPTQPTTGSHTKHLSSGAVCGNCHDSAVEGSFAIAGQHLDNNIDVYDVASGDLGYPANKTKNTAFATCNNAWCHNNGYGVKVTTPTWGQTVNNCAECHPTQPTTGSHTKHLNSAEISISCGNCHDSAVQGSSAIAGQHLDNNIDVYDVTFGDLGYPANKATNTAYATCNNAYCHDNGTGSKVTTPTWGQTSACSECHAQAPATGSHTAHLAYTGNVACGSCHDSAVQGVTAISGQHMDGNVDVYDVSFGDLGYPQNKAKNSAYSSCNNINCHGTQSPTWGTAITRNVCTNCHGDPAAGSTVSDYQIAPYNDTAGNSSATDPQVGAHQMHLTAAAGISNVNGMGCNTCHTKPSSVFQAGHIDSALPAELTFGSLATAGGAAPSYAGSTCTNTYCHNGKYFKNGWSGGLSNTPSWNDTAYLVGTSADCDNCHGYPPGGGHSASTDCSSCHPHVDAGDASFTGVANRAQHVDGVVEAQGFCNSCHGFPPYPGDGKSTINGTGGKGAHWSVATNGAHIDNGTLPDPTTADYSAGVAQCKQCHPMSDSSHPQNDGAADIGFSMTNSFDGGAPQYNGVPGENPNTTPKTCSNINCHFGNETPRWSCPSDTE